MSRITKERLLKVILGPHVSEKSSLVAEKHGQYVFKVMTCANKHEICAAVETLFKVTVDSVQVVNVKGKRKMFGRIPGKRKDWKKAYVKLAAGQQIDFSGQVSV